MRDPRLEVQSAQTWPDEGRRTFESALTQSQAIHARGTMVAGMAVALSHDGSAWELLQSAIPSFPEWLRRHVDRFLLFSDISQRESSDQAVAWLLISEALAWLATMSEASASKIQQASERLASAPHWAKSHFEATCIQRIRQLPAERKVAWTNALAQQPHIDRSVPAPGSVVRDNEASWDLQDPFDLWGRNKNAAYMLVAGYTPAQMLRLLDGAAWFKAIDHWTDPRLSAAGILSDVDGAPQKILARLSEAAPAFDSEMLWTGRVGAVVISGAAVDYAEALLGALRVRQVMSAKDQRDEHERAYREALCVELPEFLASCWRALLSRHDGEFIAAALLEEVTFKLNGARRLPSNASPSDDAHGIAHTSLVTALALAGTTVNRLREHWAARAPVRPSPHLSAHQGAWTTKHMRLRREGIAFLSAIHVASVSRTPERDTSELWAWFTDLLVTRENQQPAICCSLEVVDAFEQLASIFSRLDNVRENFERTYASLEPQRRRCELGDRTTLHLEFPSALLLLVAQRTCCHMLSTAPADAADWSSKLLTYSRRLALTCSPPAQAHLDLNTVAINSFSTFIRTHRCGSAHELGRHLAFFVGDPPTAALAVREFLGIVSRDVAEQACGSLGLSIESILEYAKTWAKATCHPRDQRAACELQESLDSLSPTPAS